MFSISELQQIASCPDEECAKNLASPRKYAYKETRKEAGRIVFIHRAGSGIFSTLSNLLYMKRSDGAKQVLFSSLNTTAFAEKFLSQISKEGFTPVDEGSSRVKVNMDSVATASQDRGERFYAKIENGIRWTIFIYTDVLLTASSGDSYGTTCLLTGMKLQNTPTIAQNNTTTTNRAPSTLPKPSTTASAVGAQYLFIDDIKVLTSRKSMAFINDYLLKRGYVKDTSVDREKDLVYYTYVFRNIDNIYSTQSVEIGFDKSGKSKEIMYEFFSNQHYLELAKVARNKQKYDILTQSIVDTSAPFIGFNDIDYTCMFSLDVQYYTSDGSSRSYRCKSMYVR